MDYETMYLPLRVTVDRLDTYSTLGWIEYEL